MGVKTCSTCKKSKPLDEFNKNSSKKDGLQNYCRPCGKAKHRDYYKHNRDRMRKQILSRNKVRRRENQKKIFDYLQNHPCVDCGLCEPCLMDFDHIDPSTKKGEVSFLLKDGYSWRILKEEIEKCEVRCANCHRRKTAREQNWFTWLLSTDPPLGL